jgi:hypothetical protein
MEVYRKELPHIEKFSQQEARFNQMIGTYFQLFEHPERLSTVMESI